MKDVDRRIRCFTKRYAGVNNDVVVQSHVYIFWQKGIEYCKDHVLISSLQNDII